MQAEASKAFFKSFQSRLIPDHTNHVEDNKDGSGVPGPGTDLRGVSRTKGRAPAQRGKDAATSRRLHTGREAVLLQNVVSMKMKGHNVVKKKSSHREEETMLLQT